MSLTFYFSPMSTASITSLILEELEVPCERVLVDIRAGGTKTEEFLKLNPNGKVPVIVHDGKVICESAAITIYLGETFGVERKLFPAPGPERGQAMQWIVWTNVSIGAAVGLYARSTSDWFPKEQHNAATAKAALEEIHGCLKILNDHLHDRDYLLGSYTLADAHLKSLSDWMRHLHIDFAPYERVNAWADRITKRPAHARAEARENPHT